LTLAEDRAGREVRVVGLTSEMTGFVEQCFRAARAILFIETSEVEFNAPGARPGNLAAVPAQRAQIVDLIADVPARPMQAVVPPVLVPVVVRGVVEQPHRAEDAGQRQVRVAAVLIPEAVIPVGLLEAVGVPGPVDEGLPAGARSVKAVACHRLVGYGRNSA